MINKQRIVELDIIKFLCIVFVLMSHLSIKLPNYIESFYVSLFFIVSGITYSKKYSANFKLFLEYVKRKIRLLYIPYIFINTILIIFHNIFIEIGLYSTTKVGDAINSNIVENYYSIKNILIQFIKTLFFQGDEQLLGGAWFPRTLFWVSLLYCLFDCLVRKIFKKESIVLQTLLSVLMLSVGFILGKNNIDFHGYSRIFTCYGLYHLGALIKNSKLWEIQDDKKCSLLFVTSLIVLLVIDYFVSPYISLNANKYNDPLSLIVYAFLGFINFYELSHFIKKANIKPILIIGQSTLYILLLHLVCFKMVSYLEMQIYDLPVEALTYYPVLNGNANWKILYIVAGIAIPTIIKIGVDKIKIRYIGNK